ncbi:MAG: hypothetical protein Q4B48_08865 [Syntrophomonadaceae bacterium]|nr:hypothetical protein [Syntrophomonadaceae bacterium]
MDDTQKQGTQEAEERKWRYDRSGRPIVQRLDYKCEDFEWDYLSLNLHMCACCRWFTKVEGTKRSYRCICENRRKKE